MAHVLIPERQTKQAPVMRALRNYFGPLTPVHKEWGIIFYQVWDESDHQIKPTLCKIKGISIFVSGIKRE